MEVQQAFEFSRGGSQQHYLVIGVQIAHAAQMSHAMAFRHEIGHHRLLEQTLWPFDRSTYGVAGVKQVRWHDTVALCTGPFPAIIQTMLAIISPERPDSADAVGLITELEAHLETLYPVHSRHGYSVEKLLAQGVAFFVLRTDGAPAGCCGIQIFDAEYGELKRMYVRPEFRGRGFGERMIDHLTDYTLSRGIGLLRLETGIHQTAAIHLYERVGFRRIPPFGNYCEDPNSLCYEKRIT